MVKLANVRELFQFLWDFVSNLEKINPSPSQPGTEIKVQEATWDHSIQYFREQHWSGNASVPKDTQEKPTTRVPVPTDSQKELHYHENYPVEVSRCTVTCSNHRDTPDPAFWITAHHRNSQNMTLHPSSNQPQAPELTNQKLLVGGAEQLENWLLWPWNLGENHNQRLMNIC